MLFGCSNAKHESKKSRPGHQNQNNFCAERLEMEIVQTNLKNQNYV